MQYQPLGNKVLLKVLPLKTKTSLVIPDHLKGIAGSGAQQFFRVEALGSDAVDEHHPLQVGQIIMISSHPSLTVGIDAEQSLMICTNKDIACICTEADSGLN